MKNNPFRNGIFGMPNGQVRSETPDGVSRTYQGGRVRTNAANAHYIDTMGHGYGAFPSEDRGGLFAVSIGPEHSGVHGTSSNPGQIKVSED